MFLLYIYELPVMDHYIFYSEMKVLEQKVYVGELIGRHLISCVSSTTRSQRMCSHYSLSQEASMEDLMCV